MGEMDGRSLLPALEGKPVREWALFGVHGCYTGITDGRMTYLKAEQNEDAPLYEYTLMPTNIQGIFRKISFAVGSWWKDPVYQWHPVHPVSGRKNIPDCKIERPPV